MTCPSELISTGNEWLLAPASVSLCPLDEPWSDSQWWTRRHITHLKKRRASRREEKEGKTSAGSRERKCRADFFMNLRYGLYRSWTIMLGHKEKRMTLKKCWSEDEYSQGNKSLVHPCIQSTTVPSWVFLRYRNSSFLCSSLSTGYTFHLDIGWSELAV